MEHEDKRKFPRVDCKCSITLWEKSGYATIFAQSVNLGVGGILVNLDSGLMVGARVDIKIDFLDNSSLVSSGQIVRCREHSQNQVDLKKFYSVGIAFEDLKEEQILFIRNLVKQLLNQ